MTRLEVDLDVIGTNYLTVARTVYPTRVMAVVKDNAYGHGLVPVACRLLREGCRELAVATLHEALVLSAAGVPPGAILILRSLTSTELPIALAYGFAVTVGDFEQLHAIDSLAAAESKRARIHIKIDTGLGRLGFLPEKVKEAAIKLRSLTSAEVVGVYSHFAHTERRHPFMDTQLQLFLRACAILSEVIPGVTRHIAATAAIVGMPEAWLDLVRPGGLFLGLVSLDERPWGLRPAITLVAPLIQVKTVPPGWNVGYRLAYAAPDWQRIGVVATGAGDSYPYTLRGKGSVLVRGRGCRVVGMSLDQLMVDLSEVPEAVPGDEAVIFGTSGDQTVTPEDLARIAGTSYGEILSRIPARVPRLYLEGGYVVAVDGLPELKDVLTYEQSG